MLHTLAIIGITILCCYAIGVTFLAFDAFKRNERLKTAVAETQKALAETSNEVGRARAALANKDACYAAVNAALASTRYNLDAWKDRANRSMDDNNALIKQMAQRIAPTFDEEITDPLTVREADRRAAEQLAASREVRRAIPFAERGAPPVAVATEPEDMSDADLDDVD